MFQQRRRQQQQPFNDFCCYSSIQCSIYSFLFSTHAHEPTTKTTHTQINRLSIWQKPSQRPIHYKTNDLNAYFIRRWCVHTPDHKLRIMSYIIVTCHCLVWFLTTILADMFLLTAMVTPKWLIGPVPYVIAGNVTLQRYPSLGINTRYWYWHRHTHTIELSIVHR